MNHLLPSNFLIGGFLVLILSGLGFLPGAGLFPRFEPILDWLSLLVGTVAPALSEGFLCVICSALTLRSPLVTSAPLFNSEKTAPKPALAFVCFGAGFDGMSLKTGGGGGGGGGGGAAPPVADFG